MGKIPRYIKMVKVLQAINYSINDSFKQEYYKFILQRRLIQAVIKGDMTDIPHCLQRKANVNFRNEVNLK